MNATLPQAAIISFNDGIQQAYDSLGNTLDPMSNTVRKADVYFVREARAAFNRALGAIGE